METAQEGFEAVRTDDDLLQPFFASCKPSTEWRIGAEAEKFGVVGEAMLPVRYTSASPSEVGVVDVMNLLVERFGYVVSGDASPLLSIEKNGASVTLEPGAQLELSGAPLFDVHAIRDEFIEHARELREVSAILVASGKPEVRWLGLGFHPFAKPEDLPWVPKPRYAVMQRYLPTVGRYGLDMMRRTATVQANFDYESEEHAMKCLRVGLRLAPVFGAMVGNSPLVERQLFGGSSYRSQVWTSVDPHRDGIVPSVWGPRSTFSDYVEWALDAPMFVVAREGRYDDATGQTFRSFMTEGRMRDGVRIWPTQTDWVTHLNSLFPEIRLKRTLEVRGGDSLPTEWVPVPSALYAGIFYDAEALGILDEETASFVPGEMQELRGQVPVQGLKAIFRGRPLASLAERVIEVAEGGLGRRARLSDGKDESKYLLPLKKWVGRAQNPGDVLAEVVRAGAVPLGEAILAHCQV